MNDYFNPTDLSKGGFARSADINSRMRAVETGFEKLPSVATLGLYLKGLVTAGGSPNAITFTHSTPISTYTLGQRVTFIAAADNTAAATINVDAKGVKNLKRADGTALVAGDIEQDRIYDAIYDGTEFRLLSMTASELTTYVTASAANALTASTKAAEASADAADAETARAGAVTASNTATTKASEAGTSATTAQNWATSLAIVSGGLYGARKYAQDAATSETNAAASAAAAAASSGIPIVTGNAGKYLFTDGSVASWGAVGTIITRNKGVTSDAYAWVNDAALTADLIGAAFASVALAYASTLVWDWRGGYARGPVVCTGNVIIGTPTNIRPNETRIIELRGDSASARTVGFSAAFLGPLPIITNMTSTVRYRIIIMADSAGNLSADQKQIS